MTPFVQSLFSNGHFEIIKSPNIEMGGRVMEKCVSSPQIGVKADIERVLNCCYSGGFNGRRLEKSHQIF